MGFLLHAAAALTAVSPGWLGLGLALHLGNQLSRGRGWWAVVRAAHPGGTGVRRRDAIAAWIAGAGVAGVLTAQVGDALRVWLLGRRAPDAGYPLLAGTLVAETAGDLLVGLPLLAVALLVGVGPSVAPTWHMAAGLAAAALAVAAAWSALRRRGRGWRVLARVRDGCAPLARPRAYAAAVAPWQVLSRACRIAEVACFLAAFGLPVTVATVLLVIFAQAGGRVLGVAPAALGATVALLAATFARVAHAPVDPARIAAFVVGTTALLTVVGVVLATIVVVRGAGPRMLAAAARARRAQGCRVAIRSGRWLANTSPTVDQPVATSRDRPLAARSPVTEGRSA
jgi:hypothetical protein